MKLSSLFRSILPTVVAIVTLVGTTVARKPDNTPEPQGRPDPNLETRAERCDLGSSRFDMDVNNVRATLLGSGAVWRNGNGGYIIPKVVVGSSQKAVSAIYAGGVWVGGKAPGGVLKIAATTYQSGTATDWWAGPLTRDGQTDKQTCVRWDRHFTVLGSEIDEHIRKTQLAEANGTTLDCSQVPTSIRSWPSRGNREFFRLNGFELPLDDQGLAKFFDKNGNGLYEPCLGDYPIIDVRGCESRDKQPSPPSQMVFWIYNDNGNVHTQSARSTPIQMEVQVQAFSYARNDQLNDMTFQRYKLINRAVSDIDSCYFAMWADPDLGCSDDDFIGCDTTRSLAYVYNYDEIDGTNPGSSVCAGGVNTYGAKIPLLGIDYFRGPRGRVRKPGGVDTLVELGMTSFTYANNGGSSPTPPPGTTDPATAVEYYRYITGFWRDGTPYTRGGTGYNPGSTDYIKYAFPDAPNVRGANKWSMCNDNLTPADRRTLQATGPLTLKPGDVNELIIGVPFVADVAHPCPDISRLQKADDLSQALFDNCFQVQLGPDAPDVTWVELDKQIIAILSNDTTGYGVGAPISNNAYEKYAEKGLKIPKSAVDNKYRFQGYLIYQLRDVTVSLADRDDATKVRLAAQVDIQDTVSTIYNWNPISDPNGGGGILYQPKLQVQGENKGIRRSFSINKDLFAPSGNSELINHKKYYFVAVAYAYNNYEKFNPRVSPGTGQDEAFFIGNRNIGAGGDNKYTVIPRPITHINLNAAYGEGVVITRLDGSGTGLNFLDMSEETLQKILTDPAGFKAKSEITYKEGRGPITIKVTNPLEVVDGTYELKVSNPSTVPAGDPLSDKARWTLRNLGTNVTIKSDETLEKLNEQVVAQFGFSVAIGQVAEPGADPFGDKTNGAIGTSVTYNSDTGPQWLTGLQDDEPTPFPFVPVNPFNFMKTSAQERDFIKDPKQALGKMSSLFSPYYLHDYYYTSGTLMLSPSWQDRERSNEFTLMDNGLYRLNNVDIVMTSDKTKWSKCVVVEKASAYYNTDPQGAGLTTVGSRGASRITDFDLRQSPSVDSTDRNGDGLADPLPGGTVGYGWFPGYAIDVETGRRVNIFFGENSAFDDLPNWLYEGKSKSSNKDMMFNPTSQRFLFTSDGTFDEGVRLFMGGQHYVYVTDEDYDGCTEIWKKLAPRNSTTGIGPGVATSKFQGLNKITWAGLLYMNLNTQMRTYAQGLIPNDVTVKLRVNNSYKREEATYKPNNGYPMYQFKVSGKQANDLVTTGAIDSSLDAINVSPNPYYGFSAYETSEFTTTVKMTNLPAKCEITIRTLDGKFIREFKRDERATVITTPVAGNREKQYTPDIEWDLKNSRGIPIASGAYLIYIKTDKGERTLKWFGVNREFDPSRL
jgi:hypothetical protein